MRRSALALLMLALLPGCVAVPFAPQAPAARHAALLAAADQAAGRVVDHLAAREATEIRESAALRFAAGGAAPRALPAPATPAAGAVLDAGMDLMLVEARRIAALAAGETPADGPEAAAALARLEAALAGLRALPGPWPAEPVRRRGAEAFRQLAGPLPAGADAARLAADRQAAMEGAAALLVAVTGADSRAGLRAVLARHHAAWRQAQQGMLATARGLDPAERLALWNRVQAALAADGPDLPAAEVVALFAALPAAHAAAGAGDAAGVEAFAAAVARLQAFAARLR